METNREQPTDDASRGMPNAGSELGSDSLHTSDSLITLKEGEQLGLELTTDAIHLDLMVEKGLIDYDSLDKPTDEDDLDFDDYQHRLTVEAAVSGHIEDLVQEMRSEFMKKTLCKAKHLKSAFMKKGLKCGYKKLKSESEAELQEDIEEEEAEEQKSKEEFGSKKEAEELLPGEQNPKEEFDSKEAEINQLVVQINEFTSNMEQSPPDSADWQQFRGSLSKVCQIYQPAKEVPDPESISELIPDQPLQSLKGRAAQLRHKISGMEGKMVSLDQRFGQFCDQLDSSRIDKERTERDMAILRCMQERIGRRLTQMETDLQQSHEHLLNKTKTVLEELKCSEGDGGGGDGVGELPSSSDYGA
ncbi:uncharacterized protein LOC117893594 isoform X2 [Drosophila subobscura]|uniref:uncharacterized protein LOC117893594 isoform X2 n=1 Tax=Drosophila subobscura TaxID=7241 RepID=UPI00155A2730|nr:uncharacterized protein LOC117893594 isoform X2 [Drosophila subobscura]